MGPIQPLVSSILQQDELFKLQDLSLESVAPEPLDAHMPQMVQMLRKLSWCNKPLIKLQTLEKTIRAIVDSDCAKTEELVLDHWMLHYGAAQIANLEELVEKAKAKLRRLEVPGIQ